MQGSSQAACHKHLEAILFHVSLFGGLVMPKKTSRLLKTCRQQQFTILAQSLASTCDWQSFSAQAVAKQPGKLLNSMGQTNSAKVSSAPLFGFAGAGRIRVSNGRLSASAIISLSLPCLPWITSVLDAADIQEAYAYLTSIRARL